MAVAQQALERRRNIGSILLAVAGLGLAMASIPILGPHPELARAADRHLLAGALANLSLALILVTLALIPIRRGHRWALLAYALAAVTYGLPIFIIDATHVSQGNLLPTLFPQALGLLLMAAGLLLSSSAGVIPVTDLESVMTAEYEIQTLFTDWKNAVRANDVRAISALVTDDAEFWPHGAPPIIGPRAVEQAFARAIESNVVEQDFEAIETLILDDIAFLRGIETFRVTPRTGGDPIVQKQRAFMLLRRNSEGKWQFSRGMTNLPPESR